MKTRIFSLFNCNRVQVTKLQPNSFEWIQLSPTDEKPISISSKGFVGCAGTLVYWADEYGIQRVFGAHYCYGHEQHSKIVKENLEKIHAKNGTPAIKNCALVTYNANFDMITADFHKITRIQHDHRREKFVSELEGIVSDVFGLNKFKKFLINYNAPPIGWFGSGDGSIKFTLDKSESTCMLDSEMGLRTLVFPMQ